jgi:hypothetical protein
MAKTKTSKRPHGSSDQITSPIIWANGTVAVLLYVDEARDVHVVFYDAIPPHQVLGKKSFDELTQAVTNEQGLEIDGVKLLWSECVEVEEKAWPVLGDHYGIFPTGLRL